MFFLTATIKPKGEHPRYRADGQSAALRWKQMARRDQHGRWSQVRRRQGCLLLTGPSRPTAVTEGTA